MATGNASSTESAPLWLPAGTSGAVPRATGSAIPRVSTTVVTTTNAIVIAANTTRPPCPNQVSPATTTSKVSASGIRHEARLGT